MSMAARKSQA
jgi:hypothetical protein